MQVWSEESVQELLRSYIIAAISNRALVTNTYAHEERVRICGQKSITNRKEKMRLKTLLKKVTLPIYPKLDPETDNARLGSTGYAIHRDSEVIADGIQTPELAQYLCHTAKVLPELVAAAKHLEQNWEKKAARSVVVQPNVVWTEHLGLALSCVE